MYERTSVRHARLLIAPAAVAILATSLGSAPALAQQDGEERIEEITVTGSRLVRRDLDAPSPVVVMSEAAIESAGNVTIEETLNEMPQLASDNTSSVNSGGGSGILTADLRGLDPERTLVLVNGRRFTPANAQGYTDLSSIPDALIERVEIITGGASAVYGSDAIAGAINFILKDDFEGMEAQYYFGETDKGDATTHKWDLTVGGNFADDRGNAVVSASYTDRGNIFFADRDYSAISLFESSGGLVPGGSGNIPGTGLFLNTTQLGTLSGLSFDPATACPGTISGIRFGEGGDILPFCDPEDRYNFAPDNYLVRPMERVQISALGDFDVNDYVTAYTELFFMDNRNEWQQAPNAGGLQTSGAARGSYLIPDYAVNPILFAPVQQFLIDNPATFDPDGDGTAELIGTGRRSTETGPRNYKYDRASYSATAGLKGDFDAMGSTWLWDSFFQFQRSKTDEDIAGQLSSLRLALGSDVIIDPDTGDAVCRNAFVGCVPVNFLGVGAISPEAAAFISPNHGVTDVLQRTVYGGSITGDLFELPAGALAAAFGFENRAEEYDFRPDTAAQGGEFGDPQPPIFGEFDVTEFYVETRVPLLEGAPMAQYLGLELAARASDYSTIGNVLTWKAGGEWAPIDWLRFRGAYNVAIRAPNLDELFATQTIGFAAGDDPCDKDFNPSQAVKDLCVQQGILPGDIDTFDHLNVGFGTQSGGNPNLREEESDTWTVGAVISPPFVEGLNLTIDYYNVEIESAIDQLSAQQIVNSCFRQLDINAETCQAIHRFSNGQIDFVEATLKNLASLNASGLDFQADYAFDLPDSMAFFESSAQMNLQFIASWAFEQERISEPGEPGLDCLGHFGGACSGFNVFMQPDAKYVFNSTYLSGAFTGRFQARHIPGLTLVEGSTNVVPSVSAKTYLDLNVDYIFNDKLTLFAGIDNIADTEPPIVGFSLAGDANVDISLYDVLGRRFFAGVRLRY